MIKSFEDVAELVKNTIIGEYPQVRSAWIFGSFSNNAQSNESDLDIL
jgi:predicted nucleotidyltransferase